jgi:hypothetical protein
MDNQKSARTPRSADQNPGRRTARYNSACSCDATQAARVGFVAEITCLFASDPANSREHRTVDLARLFGQAGPKGSRNLGEFAVNSLKMSRDYSLHFKGLPASGARIPGTVLLHMLLDSQGHNLHMVSSLN